MGGACAWIRVERGLGSTIAIAPVVKRYGHCHGGMTGVMLSHTMAPMPQFIVHGHVRHIIGNGCRGRGLCDSQLHPRP
jgi:hypothetical protein